MYQWLRFRRLLGATFLVILMAGNAGAQVNNEAYRDYFLFGRFGEVCTMCEVTVLCQVRATDDVPTQIPDSGNFTVYHLQTRTFWSQISTIWEWFMANFSSASLAARGHTRPVHVYEITDGTWGERQVVEARLLLEPPTLEFGAYHIDRVSSAWLNAGTGEPQGYCARLPLWDALEIIDREAGES